MAFRSRLAAVLVALLGFAGPSAAATIGINGADLLAFPFLGTDSVWGALQDLHSAASQTFFANNFVDIDPVDGVNGFNILLSDGPTIDVVALTGAYGLYCGFANAGDCAAHPFDTGTIYIDSGLVALAAGFDLDAQEILEDTIGHETAHWADWRDNGTNDDPAGPEDGNQWETAVYGAVKTLSTATASPNEPFYSAIPEPSTAVLLLIGLGALGTGTRGRRVRRARPD